MTEYQIGILKYLATPERKGKWIKVAAIAEAVGQAPSSTGSILKLFDGQGMVICKWTKEIPENKHSFVVFRYYKISAKGRRILRKINKEKIDTPELVICTQ